MTVDPEHTALGEVSRLTSAVGLNVSSTQLEMTGPDEWLPSIFRVTDSAAASVGLATLAAAEMLRRRNKDSSALAAVDRRHAAASFRSERTLLVDGEKAGAKWDPLAGNYRTADGWIRLHTNFDHHRQVALDTLKCPPERAQVEATVAGWNGVELETALAEGGMAAAVLRSCDEWRSTPQGRALTELPVVDLQRIGEAPAEGLAPTTAGAAQGLRVLDLTRVIAGPVCGKVLASHGADVIRVGAAHVPAFDELIVDTGFGKRNVDLDLRDPAQAETFRQLVREADVVVQGYRPGALSARGFGPHDLAVLRPGLVIVELSAYGRLGPWSERRGFDSVVQVASGIAHAGMVAAGISEPKPLPAQALDHATGWLAAFSALAGVLRQREEGGTWHAQVSLARTGRWIEDFGRMDGLEIADPTAEDVGDLLTDTPSDFGAITHLGPVGEINGDKPAWSRPPARLGHHAASW